MAREPVPVEPSEPGLALDPELADRLILHARRELPNEACAILSGEGPDQATRVHPARNRRASPYRYDLHPEDLVRIVHAIEDAREVMVATFHSHPAGRAVPSPTDLRESRYDVVHLIAAGPARRDPELRAWRIRDGRAVEVPLRLRSRG